MDLLHFIFLRVHHTTDWDALTATDYSLIGFNAMEAIFWFGCGVYVLRRNAAGHRVGLESIYAVLFFLFGLTDVVETHQVSSPLIWLKLFILVPLFVIRRGVLSSYSPRPRLV